MIFPGAVIGGYSAKGVTFDGSNDYLSRASALDGISDGKLGLLSFWMKAATPGTSAYLFYFGSGRLQLIVGASNGYANISGVRSTGASCLAMNSNPTAIADGSWHHLIAAWDMAADANCKIYIDGSDTTTLSTRIDNDIDYNAPGTLSVGAFNTGTFKLNGDVADLYFTTEWLDLTSSANREKFAKNGRPVNLGSDGSTPTGTAPIIYFKGPASNWGTNAGTGGNFTVNGAFTDASTKPSY